jgi:hypothetical protein
MNSGNTIQKLNALTCTNNLIRLTRARECKFYSCCNTLNPYTWQDFSALILYICGFTGAMIVILNTEFKLVSFCTIIYSKVQYEKNFYVLT